MFYLLQVLASLIAGIFGYLILRLLFFHWWLSIKGLTTLQYLKMKTDKLNKVGAIESSSKPVNKNEKEKLKPISRVVNQEKKENLDSEKLNSLETAFKKGIQSKEGLSSGLDLGSSSQVNQKIEDVILFFYFFITTKYSRSSTVVISGSIYYTREYYFKS